MTVNYPDNPTPASTITTTPSTERPLYGGALSVCLPPTLEDISQLRDVPDHQEVFADADTDQSIIIEVNELSTDASDSQCAQYHLREYAEAADATAAPTLLAEGQLTAADLPHLSPYINDGRVVAQYAIGSMQASKYREHASAANTVQVYMAVLRLKHVTTDLLIIYNVPQEFNPESSSAGRPIMAAQLNEATIQQVLRSLKVHDWSLFGEQE